MALLRGTVLFIGSFAKLVNSFSQKVLPTIQKLLEGMPGDRTQRGLAKAIGLSGSHVSQLINGWYPISDEVLQNMAKYFGVLPSEIVRPPVIRRYGEMREEYRSKAEAPLNADCAARFVLEGLKPDDVFDLLKRASAMGRFGAARYLMEFIEQRWPDKLSTREKGD